VVTLRAAKPKETTAAKTPRTTSLGRSCVYSGSATFPGSEVSAGKANISPGSTGYHPGADFSSTSKDGCCLLYETACQARVQLRDEEPVSRQWSVTVPPNTSASRNEAKQKRSTPWDDLAQEVCQVSHLRGTITDVANALLWVAVHSWPRRTLECEHGQRFLRRSTSAHELVRRVQDGPSQPSGAGGGSRTCVPTEWLLAHLVSWAVAEHLPTLREILLAGQMEGAC
jgi:hypothetical protein